MNRAATIERIATGMAVMPHAVEPTTLAENDAGSLQRAMADAVNEQPLGPRVPDESTLEWIRRKALHQTTFSDLNALAKFNPIEMQSRWEQMKAAARDELETGAWAGRAVEPVGIDAWERAGFLAIRSALRDSWRPRVPAESLLIDEIAQYETLRWRWMRTLAAFTPADPTPLSHEPGTNRNNAPTLSQAAMIKEASQMIDRLQKLSQRSLRSLTTLRRGKAPPIIVRQAGQVNVTSGGVGGGEQAHGRGRGGFAERT